MVYIGCDNGVSGSIGIFDESGKAHLFPTPTKQSLNYQKTKVKHITRIDVGAFRKLLAKFRYKDGIGGSLSTEMSCKTLLERPLVNPQRFDATTSALRALEATLIVLESLGIGYEYCDSKSWQKKFLPYISVADKKEYPAKLKQVSLEVGMRMYPEIDWTGRKDADGLLIAKYLKDMDNGQT
jgi:hypothetical protein